ncbi:MULTISPECIES: hypothetical protein [unclassified Cedecea]|uniref:hypothetical protein n=1 Tax=unclassified Cedecea TaxID=2649846 RepID=UPI003015F140
MLKFIGALLFAIGAIIVGWALGMEVTVGYVDKVYNTGLIANRLVYTVAGSSISIIGSIVGVAGMIMESFEKSNAEKLDVMKNINNGLADHLESK